MNELEAAFEDLRAAAGYSDAAELIMFCPIDDFAMEQEPWSDELFAAVSRMLEDREFLRLQSAWQLVKTIHDYWDNLTPMQRAEVRRPLASSFDRFGDWMGAYMVSDILGRRYSDESSGSWLARWEPACSTNVLSNGCARSRPTRPKMSAPKLPRRCGSSRLVSPSASAARR